MDRNREGRRPNIAVSNGVSRRRHRSNSLRDSPDENGPVELPEHSRLRDRGGLKKDRDRERERSSRSKRRRGSNREEGGDDSSEEEEEEETTVNEEDDEVYDVLPPNHQHRKMTRNFRSGSAADEMIGVSVPRKARSASTKRMHDWISGGGGGGGGAGGDPIHRQESASPEESASSFRKKMANNGSTKPRPHHPKSCTKPVSSSSNPEELEIEIAEVLYGLSHASNNDTAKIDSREVNKSSSDAKSRVSSPTSNTPSSIVVPQSSSLLPQNSSTVAPKRKRPRQVVENLGNLSSTKMKVEAEINEQHLNNEISSLNLEKNSAENDLPKEMKLESVLSANISTEEVRDVGIVASTKKEVTSSKESSPVGLVADREDATATATTTGMKVMDVESQREGKYQIDLNSATDYTAPPPPQLRSSPNREGVINFAAALDSNLMVASNVDAVTVMAVKEDEKVGKIGNGEAVNVGAEEKAKETMEEADSHKPVVNKESDNGNKLQHEVPKPQLQPPTKLAKDEPNTEKTAQASSFPLPMSVASWPGGLPPMGYMAPLQGLVSMDGSTMSSTPIQPLFSQPRGKRCATHYNIAKNIQYIQQLMKNPFWPAAAGSAPLFGAKPCNFNVMPPAEFNGNITGRSISSVQDKGQGSTIFPGNSEKDKGSHADQRKQPIVLQQTVPPVAPNNILHGPAFIFPFNQQQTAAAASAKSPTTPANLASNASNSATTSASSTAATTATTMSFNFPNMSVNEAQYLAILQNNPYPFPIPAVAPSNYRGAHPQAMPLLNGAFYPSQMIHPQQMQPPHQNTNTSSSGSSSQKHLQGQQQRPQGSSVNGGSGNFHNFPAPKNRPSHQQNQQHPPPARQLENETGGEDSPSTADSRVSQSRPPMSVYYGQNFSMSIHPQNLAAGLPGARASTGSGNQNEKKHQQPQTFAMSFAPMNGSGTASGVDIASQLAQNHAIIQNLPEATRQSYQQYMAAAAAAQAAQHKKHFGISEEGKAGGGDVTNVDEERKGSTVKSQPNAGQSIAFSRSELADASVSGVGATGSFSVSNSHLSHLYQHQQQQINQVQNQKLDQQQVIKLHKLQQPHDQQRLARSKTPATSNGGAYPQHLTSPVPVTEKFQNMLANFPPQCYKQKSNSNSSSSSQSPQWKHTAKTPTQVPSSLSSSTTSSLKNHTQISFGSTQKPSQPPNNNPSPSPVVVGSPTHSSISKGSTASPRSITTSTSNKIGQVSTLSPQQAKNLPSVPTQKPSILGNPPITSPSSSMATKSQMQQQQQTQQISKQAMQQAQLFFPNPYMQPPQGPNATSSTVPASSGYYLQRKRPEQQQQPQGSSGSGTSDPAKAVAAGTSFATNTKSGSLNTQFGLQSSGNMQLPGYSYVNAVPVAVQAKPAEQKQPAEQDGFGVRRRY